MLFFFAGLITKSLSISPILLRLQACKCTNNLYGGYNTVNLAACLIKILMSMKGHLLLIVVSFLFSANVMAQDKRNSDKWSHQL